MALAKAWSGTRATEASANWDVGPAQSFSVTINNLTPNASLSGGTFSGSGRSHGHSFTIRRGRYTGNGTSVKFDIIYNNGSPREKFSGRLRHSYSQLNGTIRLKDPGSLPGPGPESGVYDDYHASVSMS
ncbi:hypothetical protein BDQ12DRAFT_737425 [Crucibulum laeve]|uniref:Uncharacterized protein n=1 Tax=Crucibulum laeve TaxID=68775 RepID=A0A5C3LS28_9AGAR|nr:hypothetical protein BDQ12DRAFT_737425 [Crucibulum laeve]